MPLVPIVVRAAPGAVSVPTEGGGGRSEPTVEAEPVVPSLTSANSNKKRSEGTLGTPGRWGRGEEAEASYAKFAGVLERGGVSTRVGAEAATLASVRVPPTEAMRPARRSSARVGPGPLVHC